MSHQERAHRHLEGEVTSTQLEAVKHYLINPVEMREKDLSVLMNEEDATIEPVPVIEGFIGFDDTQLQALREKRRAGHDTCGSAACAALF